VQACCVNMIKDSWVWIRFMILNQILRGRRKTVVTKSSVLKRKEKKRKKESEKRDANFIFRLFKRYDNQESCQQKWEPNTHKVKQNIYIYITFLKCCIVKELLLSLIKSDNC